MSEKVNLYLLHGPLHGKVVQVEKRSPLTIKLPKPANEDTQYGPEALLYKWAATFEDGSQLAVFEEREQISKRAWNKLQEGINAASD